MHHHNTDAGGMGPCPGTRRVALVIEQSSAHKACMIANTIAVASQLIVPFLVTVCIMAWACRKVYTYGVMFRGTTCCYM